MFQLIFIGAKKKLLLIFQHTGVRGLFLLSSVGVLFIFPSTFFFFFFCSIHVRTHNYIFFPRSDRRTIILISYVHPILILQRFFLYFFVAYTIIHDLMCDGRSRCTPHSRCWKQFVRTRVHHSAYECTTLLNIFIYLYTLCKCRR